MIIKFFRSCNTFSGAMQKQQHKELLAFSNRLIVDFDCFFIIFSDEQVSVYRPVEFKFLFGFLFCFSKQLLMDTCKIFVEVCI